MTPKHQKIIDDILWQMHQRTDELVRACRYPVGKEPAKQTIEGLRQSPLGLHLAAIADYVEGHAYAGAGDVRQSTSFVARCLSGDPLSKDYRFPRKWHTVPLGRMVHAALLRFFDEQHPGQLVSVSDVCRQLSVKRQTVHQWIDEGRLWVIYRDDIALVTRSDVARLEDVRQQKKKSGDASADMVSS